ncbi:hypothetical protein B0T19DRAFT_406689 [Cercophora scortea]|uniref:Secreted protein n=1 Tax=Cercophora scortea TaxID=314031 RepID=A0AAE0J3F6_9PEZI|nr:hypothetical protein B0T19DRAFT_406689 [Cercophora scortea]
MPDHFFILILISIFQFLCLQVKYGDIYCIQVYAYQYSILKVKELHLFSLHQSTTAGQKVEQTSILAVRSIAT